MNPSAWIHSLHIELTCPVHRMSDDPPVDKVFGLINRDTGKVLEGRNYEKVIIADPHHRGVWIEAGNDSGGVCGGRHDGERPCVRRHQSHPCAVSSIVCGLAHFNVIRGCSETPRRTCENVLCRSTRPRFTAFPVSLQGERSMRRNLILPTLWDSR